MSDIQARPRFTLYGILGAYNYGTESIVRGTAVALREVWPECEVVYASPRPEDDQYRLQNSGVQIIPRRVAKHGSLRQLSNAALRRLSLGRLCLSENTDWISGSECLLLIGGDLYTLPPDTSFQPSQRFYSPLLDLGNWIMSRKQALVVWGASVGPFEAWPSAKQSYMRHLRGVALITAREPLTVEYLSENGIQSNVRFVADPAFLTPVGNYTLVRQKPHLPLVGVNLSPLSIRYALQSKADDAVLQTHANALVDLALEQDVELVLLPHVVSDDPADDDRRYLQRIFDIVHARIPDRVGIVRDDPGAVKMKGILKRCDAVIAARMHCGIHAASVATPALFLAYSAKARGMARYIYGSEDMCMPLEHFGAPSSGFRISAFLAGREALQDLLLQRHGRFAQDARQAAVHLRTVLHRKR